MPFIRKLVSLLALSWCLLLNISGLQAQDTVLVRFYTPHNDIIIRLDSMPIRPGQGVIYHLPKGTYVLRAWTHGAHLLEDTIEISKQNQIIKVAPMYTQEYLQYRADLTGHYLRRGMALLPMPTVGAFAYGMHKRFDNKRYWYEEALKHQKTLILETKAAYESSYTVKDIEENRKLFYESKEAYGHTVEQYNRFLERQKLLIGPYVLAMGGAAVLTYYFLRGKKPTYHDTPLLSRMQLSPLQNPFSDAGFTLTFHF